MEDHRIPLISIPMPDSDVKPSSSNFLNLVPGLGKVEPQYLSPDPNLNSQLKAIIDSTSNFFKFKDCKLLFPCKIIRYSPKHSILVGAHSTEDRIVLKYVTRSAEDEVRQIGEGTVSCIRFDHSEEVIFIGTSTGKIFGFNFPEMDTIVMSFRLGSESTLFEYCPQGFLYAASASSPDLKVIDIRRNHLHDDEDTGNYIKVIGRFADPKHIRATSNNKYVAVCNNQLVTVYSRDLRWQEFTVNLKSEEEQEEIKDYQDSRTCEIEFNRKGDVFAISHMNYIQLWRTATWKLERKIQLCSDVDISAFKFSSDDEWIVAVGKDHSVNIWTMDSKSSVPKFINKQNPFRNTAKKFYNLEIDNNENIVFTHSKDTDVLYASKGVFLEKYTFPESDFKKSENSKILVCGKTNEVVVLDSLNSRIVAWGIISHEKTVIEANGPVFSMTFDSDEKFLYVGSYAKIFKFSTEGYKATEFSVAHLHESAICALSSNQEILAAGTTYGEILIQSLTQDHTRLARHSSEISAIELKGSLLIAGDTSGLLKAYILPDLSLYHTFEGHNKQICYIKILNNFETMLTVSHDENCKFWNIHDKTELKTRTVRGAIPPKADYRGSLDVSFLSKNSPADKEARDLRNVDTFLKVFTPITENKPAEESKLLVDSCFLSQDEKVFMISTREGEIFCYNLPSFARVSYAVFKNRDLDLSGLSPQEKRLSRRNKSLYFQTNPDFSLFQRFSVSPEGRYLLVSNSTGVHRCPSPLYKENPSIIAESINIPEILNFMRRNDRSDRSGDSDKWIISPAMVNSLHFYAYEDKTSLIKTAMTANSPFLNSVIGTPLEISMSTGNTGTTNTILRQLRKRVSSDVYALETLEGKMKEINLKGYKGLKKLYDACLIPITEGLPGTCAKSVSLPVIKYASSFNLSPKDIIGEAEGNTRIAFFTSTIRMNLEIGSKESIDFLESLSACPNTDIFKTKFIQTLLEGKWQKVSWIMKCNALLYLLYLGVLGAFLVFNNLDPADPKNSQLLWACLGLNIILFFYEIFQIYNDSSKYFTSVWNYIDLSRVCFFYIFMGLYEATNLTLQDDSVYEWVLIILVILSWMRGITLFTVFGNLRHMIGLIGEVIIDIVPFAIVVLFSIIAFFFINLAVYDETEPGLPFRMQQAYFDGIGRFNMAGYNSIQILLVVLASVFNVIIMLNLVVSILRGTYNRVNNNSVVENYRQLTQLVIESESFLVTRRKNKQKTIIHLCEKYNPLKAPAANLINIKMKTVISELDSMKKQNKSYYDNSEKLTSEAIFKQEIGTNNLKKEVSDLKHVIEDLKKHIIDLSMKSNKDSAKTILKCPSGHVLNEISAVDLSFFCDICRISITDIAYNCEPCNFFMCKNCVKKTSSPKIRTSTTCSLGHQPIYFDHFEEMVKSMNYETQVCRFCNQDIETSGFHCPPCMFSVCEECSKKHQEASDHRLSIECTNQHTMKWKHKDIYGKECLAIRCKNCREKKLGAGFYVCTECPEYICIVCIAEKNLVKKDNLVKYHLRNEEKEDYESSIDFDLDDDSFESD